MATAYNVLAAKRTAGMVPNPIQLSEIAAYTVLFGPPTVPMSVFIRLIGVLDEDDLEHSKG